MKRSFLHLAVTKYGIVKAVKVSAFKDESLNKVYLEFYRTVKDFEYMQSFEWRLKNRSSKPFKKLIDSTYKKDFIIAVLKEENSNE